jgi:hypothetical protein
MNIRQMAMNGGPLSWESVSIDSSSSPPHCLSRHFGSAAADFEAYRLTHAASLFGRIICLSGLESVPNDVQSQWLSFVREYSAIAKASVESRRMMFCVCLKGSTALASCADDLLLSNHWWWSALSRGDLIALTISAEGPSPLVDSLVEEIVIELAGYDLETGELLASRQAIDSRSVTSVLRSHPDWKAMSETPLDKVILARWPHGLALERHPSLDPVGEAWGRGWCNLLRKGRLWIHPSWLLAQGHSDRIDRLVWKAQAKALLPLIDEHRERVVEYMTQHHGDAWLNWESRRFVSSPLDPVEIGYLKRLADVDRRMRREPAPILSLINWLHSARNRLAHLRCLARGDIEAGWIRMREAQGWLRDP